MPAIRISAIPFQGEIHVCIHVLNYNYSIIFPLRRLRILCGRAYFPIDSIQSNTVCLWHLYPFLPLTCKGKGLGHFRCNCQWTSTYNIDFFTLLHYRLCYVGTSTPTVGFEPTPSYIVAEDEPSVWFRNLLSYKMPLTFRTFADNYLYSLPRHCQVAWRPPLLIKLELLFRLCLTLRSSFVFALRTSPCGGQFASQQICPWYIPFVLQIHCLAPVVCSSRSRIFISRYEVPYHIAWFTLTKHQGGICHHPFWNSCENLYGSSPLIGRVGFEPTWLQ